MHVQSANRLGSLTSDRYRMLPELRMVEILLLAGWAFELRAGDRVEAAAQTKAALERWIGLGLGVRCGDGERRFDPVEVVNFLIWAGRSGRDPFWAERYVHTGRALVLEGALPSQATRRFGMTLRRCFDLRQFEAGSRIRLRLPVPLPGAYVDDLAMRPVVAASLSAEVKFDPGRIEVRLAVPRSQVVEIGVDMAFTAQSAAACTEPLAPAEAETYRRPAEGLVRVSPRVQVLADALAGEREDPWEILQVFWAYMMDALWCGAIHYDQVPANAACDWVLEHKWYDCQLGSALLVSLCRARGIPARMLSGHLLYALAPTNHFWAEVWIAGRGWMPFDLASWGLSLGGRDAAWRTRFFGQVDFRMATQILPLAFTGPMSVRFPAAWQMVQTRAERGISIEFLDLEGRRIYADLVAFT